MANKDECRNIEIELIINESLYNKKIITYDMYIAARDFLLKLLNEKGLIA